MDDQFHLKDSETNETEEQRKESYHSDYDSYRFQDVDEAEENLSVDDEIPVNHQESIASSGNDYGYEKHAKYDNRYDQYGYRDDQVSDGYKDVNESVDEKREPEEAYRFTNDYLGPEQKKNTTKRNRNGSPHPVAMGVLLASVFGIVAAVVFFILTSFFGAIENTGNTVNQSRNDVIEENETNQDAIIFGNQDEDSSASSVTDVEQETASATELTAAEVTKKVMPSMVAITNTTVQQYQDYFGQIYDQESVSAGSGIIVGENDDNLLIATNNHVISGSTDITVTFVDDAAIAGSVLGADADNDLAIVAVPKEDIPDSTLEAISIVSIGDSDAVEVGDSVVAIGNALGYGQSVSAGIVSAKNREISDSDGTTRTMIQTDASINPGNSGGALLNMHGELIGINEAKLVDTDVEGVGYAIPMSVAEPILIELGSKTAREKVSEEQSSYLGITCVTMQDQYVQSGYPEGVYVNSVTKGGPADEAGIREGDIITAFDGSSVTTNEELITALEYYAAGEEIVVSVSRLNSNRDGFEKYQLTVTLGKKSESSTGSAEDSNDQNSNQQSEEYNSQNGYFGNGNSIFDYFR